MRGRPSRKTGPFQTTPKREKGEDRPEQWEGSAESAPSRPPSADQAPEGTGTLKVSRHQCPRASQGTALPLLPRWGGALPQRRGRPPARPPSRRGLRPSPRAVRSAGQGSGRRTWQSYCGLPPGAARSDSGAQRASPRGRLIHPLARELASSDKPLVPTNSLLARTPLPQLPHFPRAAPPPCGPGCSSGRGLQG